MTELAHNAVAPSPALRVLQGTSVPAVEEAVLQSAVEGLMELGGIDAVSQHPLGDAGVIDLYVPGERLGVELKVKGSVKEILRQLLRYAEHRDVDRLVLVTTSRRIAAQVAGITSLIGVPLVTVDYSGATFC